MVPASTLMYGSIFCSVTRNPRASSSDPMEAAASPLPRDDTTPPVTKMNFVVTLSPPFLLGHAGAEARAYPVHSSLRSPGHSPVYADLGHGHSRASTPLQKCAPDFGSSHGDPIEAAEGLPDTAPPSARARRRAPSDPRRTAVVARVDRDSRTTGCDGERACHREATRRSGPGGLAS